MLCRSILALSALCFLLRVSNCCICYCLIILFVISLFSKINVIKYTPSASSSNSRYSLSICFTGIIFPSIENICKSLYSDKNRIYLIELASITALNAGLGFNWPSNKSASCPLRHDRVSLMPQKVTRSITFE